MPRQRVEPLRLGAVPARPFRQCRLALEIDPRAWHKPVGHLNCLGVERQHGHPLAQSPSPTRTDRRRYRFPLADTLRSQSRPRVPKKAASMLMMRASLEPRSVTGVLSSFCSQRPFRPLVLSYQLLGPGSSERSCGAPVAHRVVMVVASSVVRDAIALAAGGAPTPRTYGRSLDAGLIVVDGNPQPLATGEHWEPCEAAGRNQSPAGR